jgi:hypothetical protein
LSGRDPAGGMAGSPVCGQGVARGICTGGCPGGPGVLRRGVTHSASIAGSKRLCRGSPLDGAEPPWWGGTPREADTSYGTEPPDWEVPISGLLYVR